MQSIVKEENGKQVINHNNLNVLKGQLKKRLTFQYAFNYVNRVIPSGDIVIFSNADIIIENSKAWKNIDRDLFTIIPNIALCLSRHEMDEYGNIWGGSLSLYKTCQDTWCVKTPLRTIPNCNFTIGGCPQCDNAIMQRFAVCGYKIMNWGTKYKTYHYDNVKRNNGARMFLSIYCDLSIPGSINNYMDRGNVCCPFLNYNILLFENNYKTSSDDYDYNTCNYYWNTEQKIIGYNQDVHIDSHIFPAIIIKQLIKNKLGLDKSIIENKIKGLNNLTKKELNKWELFEDYISIEEQIFYYVNLLIINHCDQNGLRGMTDNTIMLFIKDILQIIYN